MTATARVVRLSPLHGLLDNRVAGALRERVHRAGPLADARLLVENMELVVPGRFRAHQGGGFEPLSLAWLRGHVQSGGHVVDVGAHVGVVSAVLARQVGPEGSVLAIEPDAENLVYLERNMAAHGFTNVRTLQVAAAGKDGVRSFRITTADDSHGFYEHPLAATVRTVKVEARSLAAIVAPISNLALVKIDVEGAEVEVLRAGLDALAKTGRRPSLLVECNPACLERASETVGNLVRLLRDHGYVLTVLDDYLHRICTAERILADVRQGSLPANWYANVAAVMPQ
ncbi:MAG: FkbM family methyltransferase [Acidimicrobiales bacterium]